MKLSFRISLLAQVLIPLALSALAACAVAISDGAATAESLESEAPQDAGTPSGCVALNGKADRRCTPGAFNLAVTQDTIDSTICVTGWTNTVRPPASYTTQMKNQQKPLYGEDSISNADLEEDHLVPLELGGNPHDPNNLWPEPRESISTHGQGAETKDNEESLLKHQVCNGQMTLDAARQKILADWTH
jgi:hypothetical protein